MMLNFGSGELWGYGVSGATPVKFGVLQSCSVDFSLSQKELYGQQIYPVAVAAAQGKITGKAKFAQINGNLYNSLFFGGTISVGSTQIASGEAATVPAASPWTVTVANAAHFTQDMGVRYANTGLPLTQVASSPTLGQYSVAAGVYTFSTTDANAAVLIDYQYTNATQGQTILVPNKLQGQAPTFSLALRQGYNGLYSSCLLFAATATKLSQASKEGDWNVPELDFSCFANAAGNTHQFNFDAVA